MIASIASLIARPLPWRIALLAPLAAALFCSRPAAADPGPPAGNTATEAVRIERVDNVIWGMRVAFTPGSNVDASTVDALAAQNGFGNGSDLSSSFVANGAWASSSMPVPVQANVGTGAGLDGAVQLSTDTWNSVPGQWFRFRYVGTTTAASSACNRVRDGVNVVQFQSGLPSGVLAVTCWMSRVTTSGTVPVEFDMSVAANIPWSTALPTPAGSFDLDSTVLHELGHALGLGHSSDPNAVMYYALAQGQSKRTPRSDDIAGIQSLYGTGGPVSTATPVPVSGSSSVPAAGALRVVPNSQYTAGANAVVVQGTGTASAVASAIRSDSGHSVDALWMFTGGRWLFFLPPSPSVSGGLTSFAGPVASVIAMLR